MRELSKINRVRKSFKYLSLCSAAVAVAIPALPSYAQSNDTAVDEDVIIVTARRNSYFTLDMRAGIEGDKWSLTAFAQNLTDEDILEEVIPAPEFGGSFLAPGAQRRFGVEAAYKF